MSHIGCHSSNITVVQTITYYLRAQVAAGCLCGRAIGLRGGNPQYKQYKR